MNCPKCGACRNRIVSIAGDRTVLGCYMEGCGFSGPVQEFNFGIDATESEQDKEARAKWYENCIRFLLEEAGWTVLPQPRIGEKTPDMKVDDNVIIECATSDGGRDFARETQDKGSASRPRCLSSLGLSCSIDKVLNEKADKYRSLVDYEEYGYVVAVYDGDSFADFPPCPYGQEESDSWSDWFGLNSHVSGILYSHWEKKHHYVPNPFAVVPVSVDLFPFAFVGERIENDRVGTWQERPPLVPDGYCFPPFSWKGQVERLAVTSDPNGE